jgi:PBSX family phage terminase large subunit
MQIKPFGQKAYDFICRPISEDARINILEGAVRSSKTWAMIPKTIQLAKEGPQGLGVMTGVSKDTIYDNVLRDLFEIIGERNFHYNRQTGDLSLFGDNWKVIGAKDEGSEKYIRGKTIAKAVGDELSLMPESFFKQLLNRMSVEGARLYGTTNPDTPFHYLYREYITDKAKIKRGMVRVIHFDLDDNPTLSDEYKTFIRNAYTGVFYLRFIEGKWVVAEGAIYKDAWNDELLFNDDTAPAGLMNYGGYVERYIGIDYGTTNPMVFLDVLDDGTVLWQVNEYYWDSQTTGIQKTDKEYADDLEAFIGPKGDAQIILDPSAASFAAELRSRGIPVIDADNEVLDGLRMTATMLKRKLYRVHSERCPHTQEEMPAYSWDKKAAERGEEKPLKTKDHTPDSVRYIVKTKIGQWRLAA